MQDDKIFLSHRNLLHWIVFGSFAFSLSLLFSLLFSLKHAQTHFTLVSCYFFRSVFFLCVSVALLRFALLLVFFGVVSVRVRTSAINFTQIFRKTFNLDLDNVMYYALCVSVFLVSTLARIASHTKNMELAQNFFVRRFFRREKAKKNLFNEIFFPFFFFFLDERTVSVRPNETFSPKNLTKFDFFFSFLFVLFCLILVYFFYYFLWAFALFWIDQTEK